MTVETPTNPLAGPQAPSLRARAARGVKIASFATAGKTAVDLLAQLALVRLLAPEHFGVFAVAQALTGFVSCFSDMAGQKFLVRRAEVTPRVFSSVFWFELMLGVAIAAAWAVLCIPILTLLGKADQVPFAQALAIWIVAERLMLPRALLDRAMRFGRVNGALFGGVLAGSVTLVATALLGWGAWCFIAGLIARTVVSAALVWTAAGMLPQVTIDWRVVREAVRFGAPLLFATGMTFAYTNIDYLIINAVAGYGMVGLYYAAYRYPHYLNQFNVVLASVVFPTFAKARDDEQLARGLHHLTRFAAAVAFVPMLAMWFEGDALLRWLLGEKWLAALFPFQCFTTLAALRLVFVHWGHVFVVKGRTRPVMLVAVLNLPLVAAAAWAGVRSGGIDGAAAAVTVVSLSTLALSCFLLLKRVLVFSYLDALAPVLRAALVSAVVFAVVGFAMPDSIYLAPVRLALGLGVYGAIVWWLTGEEIRRILFHRG